MQFTVAIFSAVFRGIWAVLFKQANVLNKAGPWVNIFTGYNILFVFGLLWLVFGWIRLPGEFFSWLLVVFFLIYNGIYLVMSPLEQLALRSEKLSSLQPYANFSRIFAILCGFLLLGERNIVTFIVAIIAFLGTVIYATRGKQRRFSRGVLMYLASQILRGTLAVLAALLLTENDLVSFQMTGAEFASYEALSMMMVLTVVFLGAWYMKLFKKSSWKYYAYRYGSCFVWDTGYLLWLFLVADLGIITTSILSLITIAVALIMGYFLFHDRPERKDIGFAVLIVILICIGYVFKDVTI